VITGLVLFAKAVTVWAPLDFGLKISSRNGNSIPREIREKTIDKTMKRIYRRASLLYLPIYLKTREYFFMMASTPY